MVAVNVACINNDAAPLRDFFPVEGGMIGYDDHAMSVLQQLRAVVPRMQTDIALQVNLWHVRIAISNFGATLTQQADDIQRWALAHVIDISLVRYAQYQYPRTANRPLLVVQCVGDLVDHMERH